MLARHACENDTEAAYPNHMIDNIVETPEEDLPLVISGVCAHPECGYAVTGVHETHCCIGCFKYYSKKKPFVRHGKQCRKIADSSKIYFDAMREKQNEDDTKVTKDDTKVIDDDTKVIEDDTKVTKPAEVVTVATSGKRKFEHHNTTHQQ